MNKAIVEKWAFENGYELKPVKIQKENTGPRTIVFQVIGDSNIFLFYQVIRETSKKWVIKELDTFKFVGDYPNTFYIRPMRTFKFNSKEFFVKKHSLHLWEGSSLQGKL
jgi:hypothetical protein